jgi:hypothetical protein
VKLQLQEDMPVEDVVATMEGGPYQEYFAIEIPVGAVVTKAAGSSSSSSAASGDLTAICKKRRFVYVPDITKQVHFPMHLGLEVNIRLYGWPMCAENIEYFRFYG